MQLRMLDLVVPIALCALLLSGSAQAQPTRADAGAFGQETRSQRDTAWARDPAAASASTSELARARELTLRATTAYRAEHYDAAAELFEGAYAAVPVADLQFNLGQCYRHLKRDAEARQAFTRYLRARPAAPEREEIERWIAEANTRIARWAPPPEAATAQHQAPDTSAQTAVDRALEQPSYAERARSTPVREHDRDGPDIYERWWFWTALGVVAAGGVTAALVLDRDSESAPAGSLGTVRWN